MTTEQAGVFVVVEGPSGSGKTTLIEALSVALTASGHEVVRVKQPSSSPIGALARSMADVCHGLALACLVAADRYEQLDSTIRPAIARGCVVVCDRYVPSSLVLQGLDGVDEDFIHMLNARALEPDLYVFLDGDPETVRARAALRGQRDRFHREFSAEQEVARYEHVATSMEDAGVPVLRVPTVGRSARDVASTSVPEIMRVLDKTSRS